MISGIGLAICISAGSAPTPSLLPDSIRWDSASFLGITVRGSGAEAHPKAVRFEKIRFDESGFEEAGSPATRAPGGESALGRHIASLVEDTLANAFGKSGEVPDYARLAKVFASDKSTILKGRVLPGKEESVQYYWTTPAEWLRSLESMTRAGKRFRVSLSIIWLYQDPMSNNRFWAVVKQGWETRDRGGKLLYSDNGFLFLNFDLDSRKQPRNLKVEYRLWFHDYKSPDPKRGLKRYQRIEQDISGALDAASQVPVNFGRLEGDRWVKDSKERGISGVDRVLLDRMKQDLVEGIKAARGE